MTPVKADRIIIELGGFLDWMEAYSLLLPVADKLPFDARFISKELLEAERLMDAYVAAHNVNPFANARFAMYHNYAGCHRFISPYHLEWGTTKYH